MRRPGEGNKDSYAGQRLRRPGHTRRSGPGEAGEGMSRLGTPTNVVAVGGDRRLELPDRLAAEEPMEIRVGGPGDEPTAVSVTMRTPGHDFELAVGFLRSEGVVTSDVDVASVRYCDVPPGEAQRYNIVTVRLARPAALEGVQRTFSVTAACGICGTAALAGIPILAAVSAPSSLAVTTARDLGMSVVGFIRGQRANVYSHPGRLDLDR